MTDISSLEAERRQKERDGFMEMCSVGGFFGGLDGEELKNFCGN